MLSSSRSLALWAVLAVLAFWLTACAAPAAPALTPAPAATLNTVRGPLTGYDPQARTITLNDTVLPLAANAEIAPGLALGQAVMVDIAQQADGTVMVLRVSAPSADSANNGTATPGAPASGEQEWTGTLSTINGNVWVIGGQAVQVTAQTEIKDSPQIGQRVKVHASQSNGMWVAREIERADEGNASGGAATPRPGSTGTPGAPTSGEQEWTGTLSAINGNVWVIGGQAVQVTAQTEIKDSPQIGQRVKVHASQSNGMWVAREIERADEGNASGGGGDDDDDKGGDDD